MNRELNEAIKQAIQIYPRVVLHMDAAYKSYDFFLARIEGLVRGVYTNNIGGEFIDVFANLISGQYQDAYAKAWRDSDGEGLIPDYLQQSYQEAVSNQYAYVDGFYRAIVDARIDGTPIEPLMARARLWAQGYNTAYENASSLITLHEGANEEWVLGATEQHCSTCFALNGIVMRASEWEALNLRPKNPPNDHLECGGWRCDCERRQTSKRRSPGAYGRVEEILLVRK